MLLVASVADATNFKRLFIRSLLWDSERTGNSLWENIKTAAISKVEATADGSVLVGTSSKGHSVTLALPSGGQGFTPAKIASFLEEIVSRYEAAKAYLIAEGNPTPTDDQIVTEMLSLMVAVTEYSSDYTELRCS